MTSKTQKTKGFTLIESLIFLSIGGIFIVLLFGILSSFLKSRGTARRLSALQETSTYIFNELTQEIHWSDEAEITNGGPLNELKLIQVQANGEPDLEIVFKVEGGRLLKEAEPISPPNVAVNSFQVKDRAPGEEEISCLEIKLGLEYAESEPKIISETKTTISLRKTKFKSFEEP